VTRVTVPNAKILPPVIRDVEGMLEVAVDRKMLGECIGRNGRVGVEHLGHRREVRYCLRRQADCQLRDCAFAHLNRRDENQGKPSQQTFP
jgi:hypothetical protein